uniref:Cytochrome b561 domain-containing protein n=1 Tax=Ciona savignyi TaxID=51511 RepID=H2YQI1_CIOSA
MFVSWKYNQAQSTFDFEVSGGSAGAQYAAFAFAPSTRMENADLYYCTSSAVKSGAIQVNQRPPAVDAALPAGITSTQTGANGGAVQCSFTRAASITKDLLSANTVVDISSTQYYLLVATGPSTGSSIGYHGQNSRTASPSAIDFKLNEDIGGNTSSLKANLVKAHASLMIIAWLTCASIGVIIARHFKPLFHGRTCIKEKVWFQIHRSLMITAVLATMLAFILIFVSIEGYSANAGAHPIIGIIVTCLAITNPIMAVFRPHPDEKNRVIFNWAHWFVGTAAHILGITAIFLGVDLTRLNLPEWDTWVLVGFVVFHVVVEVILEILSAFYGHIAAYKKKPKNSMNMDGEPASKDPPPKGAGIKYFILVFYSLGNIGFMITFIVFIAMNE